jgi:hypothetical protein
MYVLANDGMFFEKFAAQKAKFWTGGPLKREELKVIEKKASVAMFQKLAS